MIGPILLAISWLLLRWEGRRLDAIGIDQPKRRFVEFLVGFCVLGAIAAVQQLGFSLASHDPFVLNTALERNALVDGLRFTVNSVLYEELLFRGYLLYRAVRWFGPSRAVLIDAAAFGMYHWFSYGVVGNPVAMIYVFLLTGAFGLMWARAFVVTGSVSAPIGLHLGWNAISYLVFSAGPLGAALLVPASGAARVEAHGWANVALSMALPLVTVTVVMGFLRRQEVAKARADMEHSQSST